METWLEVGGEGFDEPVKVPVDEGLVGRPDRLHVYGTGHKSTAF